MVVIITLDPSHINYWWWNVNDPRVPELPPVIQTLNKIHQYGSEARDLEEMPKYEI